MLPFAIAPILEAVSGIVSRIFPDLNAEAHDKFLAEFEKALMDMKLGQAELAVDSNEALNVSFFIAGWRPFIGWVCGIGLAYNTIVLAVIKSVFMLFYLVGVPITTINTAQSILPNIDMTLLGSILLQMLGMGVMSTLRTIEKVQGVNRDNFAPIQPDSQSDDDTSSSSTSLPKDAKL